MAVRECGSSDGDRRLAKVVAGVVERMGLRAPRWAHRCRSDRSGWLWVARQGPFAGIAVLGRRVISIRWRRVGVSGWVRAGGSAREPGCLDGGHGQHLGCGSSEKTLRLVDGSQRRSVTAAASGGLAALRVLHRRVRSGKTRAPHARRRGEQDMAGAPSRPRISMISDVSSGVPTARPCTWIRSPTSARMATPLKGPSDSLHLPASRWKRDELSQVRAKTLNHPTSLAGRSFGSRASVAQRAL